MHKKSILSFNYSNNYSCKQGSNEEEKEVGSTQKVGRVHEINGIILLYTNSLYAVKIGCMPHVKNLDFKFKLRQVVMHLGLIMYTLSVYIRLIQ